MPGTTQQAQIPTPISRNADMLLEQYANQLRRELELVEQKLRGDAPPRS